MRPLHTKKQVEEAEVLELEGQVMTMTKKRDERKSIKGMTGNGTREENKRRRKRKREIRKKKTLNVLFINEYIFYEHITKTFQSKENLWKFK